MRVGVVGLGDIGFPIAMCYVKGGHDVTAFDLRGDVVDRAVQGGARAAHGWPELAEASDVLCVVVVDDAQLSALFIGADGILPLLREETVVVIHTSAHPDTVSQLADAAAPHGVRIIDAPVSGGRPRAEAGTLTVMVGGDAKVVDVCRPLLEALGSVHHIGPLGTGMVMKLVNNLMFAGAKMFVYEGLTLARAFGIDEPTARAVAGEGTAESFVLRNLEHFDDLLLNHTQAGTPEFYEFLSKDPWNAAATARSRMVHLPLVAVLAELQTAMHKERVALLLERRADTKL
jgi:3-hydroxyisobutyrate dehydrogenase